MLTVQCRIPATMKIFGSVYLYGVSKCVELPSSNDHLWANMVKKAKKVADLDVSSTVIVAFYSAQLTALIRHQHTQIQALDSVIFARLM